MRTLSRLQSRRSGSVQVSTALLMALVLLVAAAAWGPFGGDVAQGVQAGGQDIQAVTTHADAGPEATSDSPDETLSEDDSSTGRRHHWLAWLWSKLRARLGR